MEYSTAMRQLLIPPVRRLLLTVVVGVSIAAAAPAAAGVPTDQLRTHVDRVLKVLQDPELVKQNRLAERRQALRKIANDIFDFEEIARRTLGRHWQPRSPDERKEFVGLMADLLEQAYIGRIEGYSGEKVQFLGDTIDGDVATVRTRIVSKNGTEIPVDYRMLGKNGRWIAYDVFVEGVSLVGNYRGQFDRIIQRQSYPELVKALRAKQAERKDVVMPTEAPPKAASGAPAPSGPPRVQTP